VRRVWASRSPRHHEGVECHCSTPLRWLEGDSARGYVDEHLSKRWVDDFNWRTGYMCPDSGQLWALEFPEGSETARLRVVDDEEWQRLKHLAAGGTYEV
jgi:hypothetical protein